MRDFPPPTTGDALGTLINRVRYAFRSIQISQSVFEVLELLGEPDRAVAGLKGWLPESTTKELNDLGSRFISLTQPVTETEETFIYINPYRETIIHCVAFAQGKVVKVWETSCPSRKAT